jgi:hypothetical protein
MTASKQLNKDKAKVLLTFVFILAFYLLFPTNNSTLDAYVYAGYIKYFQNIFTPHHLLYNIFMYVFTIPLKYFNFDVLSLTKIINSTFAVLNLYIFYQILSLLKLVTKEKLLLIIILGFSFSQWRFGTENETYTIPIFFSLLSSYYFLKFSKQTETKYIFLSGLMAAIACLFHQIHFFWWLGLLIGFFVYKRTFKTLIAYSISALLVPIVYSLVLIFYQNQRLNLQNMIHFVFHDLIAGSVMTNFGWKGVFFQLLNSFRSFFQIHPNIYYLIKTNYIFILPLIIGLYTAFIFIKLLINKDLLKKRDLKLTRFINIHIAIFIANYLFAYYNYGNIEFMVMLPFLLFIILIIKFKINTKLLTRLAITLFVWNFSYGIFPNNYYSYYNDTVLVDYIIDNSDKTFIIKNADVVNHNFYKTGVDNESRIILYYQITTKGIDSILKQKPIYTDLIDKPVILNKEKLTSTNNLEGVFDKYKKERVLTYDGFYGQSSIYKIFID